MENWNRPGAASPADRAEGTAGVLAATLSTQQPPTAAAATAASEHSLLGAASEGSGIGQLSAASGALSAPDAGGLSSQQHSVMRSHADLSRSLSMQPPPSPPLGDASSVGAAAGGEAGTGSTAADNEPAVKEPAVEEPATKPVALQQAAPASLDSPPAESAESDVSDGSDSTPEDPLPASPSMRLSVRQLLEAREKERQAAGGVASGATQAGAAAAASAASSAHSTPRRAQAVNNGRASRQQPASRSNSRLASSCSSPAVSVPALSARRHYRAAAGGSPPGSARAESSAASSVAASGSRLSSDRSFECSLLRPTASFVAGLEATESRKQLLAQKSMPCTYMPQITETRPFKLSCDERAKYDHTRVAEAAKLTSEERKAQEIIAGREALARELKSARERCRRTLTAQPLRHTPPKEIPTAQFKLFKLRSIERHEAYAQQFARKVEEQRQEDEMHRSSGHGSRTPSRIGALHGSSLRSSPGHDSGTPPVLATEQRATRHAERSAERRQREEAEAAHKEAERVAQLTAEERQEEEERLQHRFKARPMPDFASRPVFQPDKSKSKPATKPREFRFNERFGAGAGAGAQDSPRQGST